jgi:hypothetical protein
MIAIAAWIYVIRGHVPGMAEFFIGPLAVGGAMIFWLLYLHVIVCRDTLEALGFGIKGLARDMLAGCLMGAGFLLLKWWSDPLLASWFGPRTPSGEILSFLKTVSHDPWLLALWLGPVVWIGVAGFEELWRVVILRRLWLVFGSPAGSWAVLVVVSALVGALHGYQGPAAIVSIGFKSLLMGWYFKATGRTRTLTVSHAVYDSVQIILAVLAIRAST